VITVKDEMEQLTLRYDIPLALVSPDELYKNAEAFIDKLKEDRRFERKSSSMLEHARVQPSH
jgi:hypothetical protein